MTVAPQLPARFMLPGLGPVHQRVPADDQTIPASGTEQSTATTEWRALSGQLAGVDSMRLRRFNPQRGKYVYPPPDHKSQAGTPRRRGLPLTATPPDVPAAVMLYDDDGWCRVIALDFDPTTHGAEAVTADVADAIDLLTEVGIVLVADVAASGGRHVWIPLAQPARVEQLRELMEACSQRWRTLDISPACNPKGGCLTPPGSRCKDGNFRHLTIPLADAVHAVEQRNPPSALLRLTGLMRHLTGATAEVRTAAVVARYPAQRSAGTRVRLAAPYEAIAIGGKVPDRNTAAGAAWTRSEACFAVLCSAARRGLSLETVETNMERGHWSGLHNLYVGRYGHRWQQRLHVEWDKASRVCNQSRIAPDLSVIPTQEPHNTGGAPADGNFSAGAPVSHVETERALIAQWLPWAETMIRCNLAGAGAAGHTAALAVVHGIAYMAWRTGSRFVAAGVRSYSRACAGAVDHTTVADVLRVLREAPPHLQILRRLCVTNGRDADLIELVIPDSAMSPSVDRAAILRPIPAVFGLPDPSAPRRRLLGVTGWRLYRTLASGASGTPGELAVLCGLSRSTVYKLLPVLASLELAAAVPDVPAGRWRIGDADPQQAGARLGTQRHLSLLDERHKRDRAAWRDRLARYIADRPQPPPTLPAPEPLWWPPEHQLVPPEHGAASEDVDAMAAAMAILTEEFGAVIVTRAPVAFQPAVPMLAGRWLRTSRRRPKQPCGTIDDHGVTAAMQARAEGPSRTPAGEWNRR